MKVTDCLGEGRPDSVVTSAETVSLNPAGALATAGVRAMFAGDSTLVGAREQDPSDLVTLTILSLCVA